MPRTLKILHYVFGMASDFGGKPWSLMHHVCSKRAVDRIKPNQMFLHYEYDRPPIGWVDFWGCTGSVVQHFGAWAVEESALGRLK